MAVADERTVLAVALSPGQPDDVPAIDAVMEGVAVHDCTAAGVVTECGLDASSIGAGPDDIDFRGIFQHLVAKGADLPSMQTATRGVGSSRDRSRGLHGCGARRPATTSSAPAQRNGARAGDDEAPNTNSRLIPLLARTGPTLPVPGSDECNWRRTLGTTGQPAERSTRPIPSGPKHLVLHGHVAASRLGRRSLYAGSKDNPQSESLSVPRRCRVPHRNGGAVSPGEAFALYAA